MIDDDRPAGGIGVEIEHADDAALAAGRVVSSTGRQLAAGASSSQPRFALRFLAPSPDAVASTSGAGAPASVSQILL